MIVRVLRTTMLIAVAGLVVLAYLTTTGKVRLQPILTGSMAPHYPTGAMVAVSPVHARSLRVGDIVMFRPPPPWSTPTGAPVLHRIVQLDTTPDGRVVVRTKGDANTARDPWTLDASRGGVFRLRGSSVAAGRALAVARSTTKGPALMVWPGLLLVSIALRLNRRPRYVPRHALGRPVAV